MNAAARPSSAADEGPLWSATAAIWEQHWARLAEPARELIADHAAIGPGTRLLDMGCGTGELCRLAADRGAVISGIDAAPGMIERARARVPGGDFRVGPIESLPWDDDSFDVVTAFNSLQFAADRLDGFREARRVARPGGLVAVCVWGPRDNSDLPALFDAVRALGPAEDAEQSDVPKLGEAGVLEAVAAEAGLTPLATGDVAVPYEAADIAALAEPLRLDLIHAGIAEQVDRPAFGAAVERAAAANRQADGSYRFENHFRWLLAAA
jgi:SAM-dependent methyltransferase